MIDFELDGKFTSKKLLDIYSISHLTHGILLYFLLRNVNGGIYIAIILEIIWEWLENTDYVIKKYRQKDEYKNYTGDSVLNIIGDTVFTLIGYLICMKSEIAGISLAIISEMALFPFKANFLTLSIGSLLQPT